jgi:hypothetical protein
MAQHVELERRDDAAVRAQDDARERRPGTLGAQEEDQA